MRCVLDMPVNSDSSRKSIETICYEVGLIPLQFQQRVPESKEKYPLRVS